MRYIIYFICTMFVFGLTSKVIYSQELKSQRELAYIATELYHENYDLQFKLNNVELEIQKLTLKLESKRILIKKLKREITVEEADIVQAEILGELMGIQFAKLADNIFNRKLLPLPLFTDIYRR